MSRFALWTVLLALLGASAVIAEEKKAEEAEKKPDPSPIVSFPDTNLEAAVRRYVFAKRDNEEPLTEEDVRRAPHGHR